MNGIRISSFHLPIDARGRRRRTATTVGQASTSREGVGGSGPEAEGACCAALDGQAARVVEPARPTVAQRRDAGIPAPIYGASARDRVGVVPSSRSTATPGPRRAKRLLAALALATGLAFAFGASPVVADAQGDAGLVLKEYGAMYEALVANETKGVAESASKIADLASGCANSGAVAEACAKLADAAKKVVGKDLEALRAQFKELSVRVDHYLRAAQAEGWTLYYCPMAGGFWIQTAEGVRNPYYGPSMLKCGDPVAGPAELD